MQVMKFGGSSVANSERIRDVGEIVISRMKQSSSPPVVVVSALKGITDDLINAAHAAEAGDDECVKILNRLQTRHHQVATKLVKEPMFPELKEKLDTMIEELRGVIHGVTLVRECSLRTKDLISGFGERLSSLIICAHIVDRGVPSSVVDAREIIRTDGNHGRANVDFPATETLVKKRLGKLEGPVVIPGFIASTADGVTTTLGRNGSDYTASILGAALNSEAVEIWTDVDGILTADPRIVPNAWVINEVSFQEAMELSFFGAEVIHPLTLVPVIEKNLPVYIKNTMNPSAAGTMISKTVAARERSVTGIASIDDVSMITIKGGGTVGMPDVSSRIFSSVAAAGVNIIMISQASSENSICLICRKEEARKAVKSLWNDLSDVRSSRMIRDIELTENLEIVAVIGENMRGEVGLSGRLFSALGNAGVNILAIAQGSTELNISFVINKQDRDRSVIAVHQTFIG